MNTPHTPVKRPDRAAATASTAPLGRAIGRRRQAGFTMLEMVVTLIIVGILAVTILPKFGLLSGFDEVGYRDKVKATIEFARKAAVAQRRYACAVISGDDVTLTIESAVPESHSGSCPYAREITLPAPDRSCSGGVTNKVCHPSRITLTAGSIMFDPLGRRVSGVNTYPGNEIFTVDGTAAGGQTWTFKVESETGYVH